MNHCCDLYSDKGTQILTVNTGVFGTFTGQTDCGGLFQFTSGGANPTKFSIEKPVQASDIFGAVGTLQAPNGTALGAVAAILDAALNRTVLRKNSVQPSCNTGDFYSTALVLEAF